MIEGKGDVMAQFEGFKVIDSESGEEADVKRIAKSEKWASSLVWTDMAGFALDQDGDIMLMDGCGNYAWPPDGRFEAVAP